MTYNVFSGMLNLTQSISLHCSTVSLTLSGQYTRAPQQCLFDRAAVGIGIPMGVSVGGVWEP